MNLGILGVHLVRETVWGQRRRRLRVRWWRTVLHGWVTTQPKCATESNSCGVQTHVLSASVISRSKTLAPWLLPLQLVCAEGERHSTSRHQSNLSEFVWHSDSSEPEVDTHVHIQTYTHSQFTNTRLHTYTRIHPQGQRAVAHSQHQAQFCCGCVIPGGIKAFWDSTWPNLDRTQTFPWRQYSWTVSELFDTTTYCV